MELPSRRAWRLRAVPGMQVFAQAEDHIDFLAVHTYPFNMPNENYNSYLAGNNHFLVSARPCMVPSP